MSVVGKNYIKDKYEGDPDDFDDVPSEPESWTSWWSSYEPEDYEISAATEDKGIYYPSARPNKKSSSRIQNKQQMPTWSAPRNTKNWCGRPPQKNYNSRRK